MPKIDKDAIKPGMLLTGGGYAASSRALPRDLNSAEADPLAVLKKEPPNSCAISPSAWRSPASRPRRSPPR